MPLVPFLQRVQERREELLRVVLLPPRALEVGAEVAEGEGRE